jgi:hypothetical protein
VEEKMSRTAEVLLPLLLLAVGACEPSRRDEAPADAEALDGAWVTTFRLESHLLGEATQQERTVGGEIALLRNPSLSAEPRLSGFPTHSGSYAASFRPFGFEIRGSRDAPALVARLGAADSVEVVLQPDGEAPLRMAGVLAGDSVAGRWWYAQHRGGSASGSFSMRRR